jgi:hypothetical protein
MSVRRKVGRVSTEVGSLGAILRRVRAHLTDEPRNRLSHAFAALRGIECEEHP